MRNVEIKAKIPDEDLEKMLKVGKELSQSSGTIIQQHDTFFVTPKGRLKLRKLADRSELIYYERPDQLGPKLSSYDMYTSTGAQDDLSNVLEKAYGIKGIVEKKRTLFMIGQTRLHVDEVKNLGAFIELEVVLNDDQTVEEGQTIADGIIGQIKDGIKLSEYISGAYMDLIFEKEKK